MTIEHQTFPRSASRIVGSIFGAVMAFLTVLTAALVYAGEESPAGAATVMGLAAALLLMLYGWFRSTTLTVRIDADGVFVRFSRLFHKGRLIPWQDIASWRLRPFRGFGEFGGWGIRWDMGRKTGYIWDGGSALELTLTNGKHVVVTIVDAHAATRAMEEVGSQTTK